jgi:hypothetical protein
MSAESEEVASRTEPQKRSLVGVTASASKSDPKPTGPQGVIVFALAKCQENANTEDQPNIVLAPAEASGTCALRNGDGIGK